jgi:hypothetical protein
MSSGALFWIITFIISTIAFFIIAAFVTYFGMGDLKDLLSKSEKHEKK